MGRFGLLADGHKRITSPMIRDKEGKLKECTLDEALEAAGSRMKKLGKNFTGVVSSRLPSETLSLFCKFMKQAVGSNRVDTMGGEAFRVVAEGTKAFNKKSEATRDRMLHGRDTEGGLHTPGRRRPAEDPPHRSLASSDARSTATRPD